MALMTHAAAAEVRKQADRTLPGGGTCGGGLHQPLAAG